MLHNGHHGPVAPADHTSILIGFALRLGRLEGKIDRMDRQQHHKPPPSRDWVTILIGMVILFSAAAGKVTWADALPSVMGLFGR